MTPNGLRGRVIHEIVENSSLLVPFVPAPESLGAERRADHTWRVRCAKPLVNG